LKKHAWIAVAGSVALVALYPGLAWLMGIAIESRVGLSAERLRGQTPYLTLVEQQFHRGWYASTQDLTLEVAAAPLAGLPQFSGPSPANPTAQGLRFTIHSVIHHGPICGLTCLGLARIDSRLVLSDDVRSAVAKLFGPADPLTIRSRLGFFGGGITTISSPAIKDLDRGAGFGWDGLQLTVAYSRHGDSIALRGAAPRILFTGVNGSRIELRTLALDSTIRRVSPLLHATNMDFGVDRMAFSGSPGNNLTTVEHVRYLVKTTTDAGFMDMAFQLSSGVIDSASLKLQAAHFDMTLGHLQMTALETLNENMQEFNRQPGGDSAAGATKLLAAVRGPAADLLLQRPEMHLDRINLVTNGGQIALKGAVRLSDVAAADFADGADPKAFFGKIIADLEFSIDDAALADLPFAAARADVQLQALANRGFANHDKGRWLMTIHYEHGQTTVNGKPFQAAGSGI
jgi:uncharacterized protein YdgA (DUF945 family)